MTFDQNNYKKRKRESIKFEGIQFNDKKQWINREIEWSLRNAASMRGELEKRGVDADRCGAVFALAPAVLGLACRLQCKLVFLISNTCKFAYMCREF